MSRAFGSRSSRHEDDPAPELDDVLSELHISEQENGEPYELNRLDFPDAPAPAPPAAKPAAKSSASQELEAHRKRMELLLKNAREIEEMLAKEAAQARALGENLKLDEKRAALAEAAEKEQQAAAHARTYAQNGETAAAYQAKIDGELAAARVELSTVEASVKELQARLADAQDLAVLSKAKVVEAEARSKEAAKRASMAAALTRDAEIRVAKCREAREAAEAEVAHGEELANSIALTTQTLKRIRDLGSTGAP